MHTYVSLTTHSLHNNMLIAITAHPPPQGNPHVHLLWSHEPKTIPNVSSSPAGPSAHCSSPHIREDRSIAGRAYVCTRLHINLPTHLSLNLYSPSNPLLGQSAHICTHPYFLTRLFLFPYSCALPNNCVLVCSCSVHCTPQGTAVHSYSPGTSPIICFHNSIGTVRLAYLKLPKPSYPSLHILCIIPTPTHH